MNLLKDKIAIVTGGNRGIGEGIVKAFIREGATVISTYRNEEDTKKNKDHETYKLDVRDNKSCEIFINFVIKKYRRIDVLVNNAGITKEGLLIRFQEKDWDDILNTNLKSFFNMTKPAINGMLHQGGSIINISSIAGVYGNAGQCAYASSKAGAIAFTKSVAKEYATKNIRCNAVAPGIIYSDMTKDFLEKHMGETVKKMIPLRRIGEPDDVAGAVVFLASSVSSYITGQVIQVDGGMIL